jgi:cystathionine beta-lyase
MMAEDDAGDARRDGWNIETLLAHAGRDPRAFHGFINPPVVRASTVLFESVAAMQDRAGRRYSYGLTNTPTIEALTDIVSTLEGAAGAVLLPSGLAAVSTALLLAAAPGARVLVPDNTYGPTRRFCDETLTRLGVETVYYDPLVGSGIADLFGANTKAVCLEAPGSLTFEVPDVPAIVAAAKAAGVLTMLDSTWATPLIYRPIEHGVDIAIHAGTKYLGGHSDLLIGYLAANAHAWPELRRLHRNLGVQAGTEEIWLTLRGLRTLSLRLERHEASALALARWLQGRGEVKRVLHPSLPDHPGHAAWARDFGRSTSLFSFVLDAPKEAAARFLDALRIFGLGYSFGGFESLAVLCELAQTRTAVPWKDGPVIRLHVGLEDPRDLIADLERGFAAMES